MTEDSLFSAVCLCQRIEDDSDMLPKIPAVIDDTQNGRPLDTDMDRSTTSLACSEMSGLASMRSLARRIKDHVSVGESSDRSYGDEIPSRVMELKNSSSGSLRLFEGASDTLSLASSMSIDHSCMGEEADTLDDSCEMDVT